MGHGVAGDARVRIDRQRSRGTVGQAILLASRSFRASELFAGIALLGAIESLLSAVVADGMAGTKHDPNAELVGQGAGNLIAGNAAHGITIQGGDANFIHGNIIGADITGAIQFSVPIIIALIAAPLLLVFGALFAAADAEFSDQLQVFKTNIPSHATTFGLSAAQVAAQAADATI